MTMQMFVLSFVSSKTLFAQLMQSYLIASMYGIFAYISRKNQLNVGDVGEDTYHTWMVQV